MKMSRVWVSTGSRIRCCGNFFLFTRFKGGGVCLFVCVGDNG